MNVALIGVYLGRALLFALAVSAVWSLLRMATRCGRKRERRREALLTLFVFYLAALVEIIALRDLQAVDSRPQPVLLHTTLAQLDEGFGAFVYHTAGNLLWFVPLGLLVPRLWPQRRLGTVTALGLGLSLLVEACQYLLGTGVPDVDDLLLNTLGAMLGYGLHCLHRRLKR